MWVTGYQSSQPLIHLRVSNWCLRDDYHVGAVSKAHEGRSTHYIMTYHRLPFDASPISHEWKLRIMPCLII